MTQEEYRAACMDVVYLASCAVNGEVPDAERVGAMRLEALHHAADSHMLTAITARMLAAAGVKDPAFLQDEAKASRKAVVLDADRAAVLAGLEKAGIWYMLLKGSILKDCYPGFGMRQMADVDILFDADRAEDVRDIMLSLGFTAKSFRGGEHDSYSKPPVSSFEMHRTLFGLSKKKKVQAYYADVKSRLVKDEDNAFGWHFTPEDFYVYMTAHEYRHYYNGGTGLRSLLDVYVFLKKYGDSLDRDYLGGVLNALGYTKFERKNRELAMRLFGGEELTGSDREMLDYILFSGTYGNVQNRVKNRLRKTGNGPWAKVKYLFGRVFVSRELLRISYPVFAKYPILLPFFPFYRLYRSLKNGRKGAVLAELKALAVWKK